MTNLDRLLDSSASPRTRALLRAGTTEAAPEGFSRQLLASVGAAAAASAVTTSATATLATSAKVGAAVSGAASSSGVAPSLALVAAKWVTVGVLGGGVLAAGADLAFSPGRSPEAPLASTPSAAPVGLARPTATPAPPTAHSEPALTEPALAEPALPSTAAPSSVGTANANAGAAALAPSAEAHTGPLGREVQVIDRVRRALAAGNTSLALSELDVFARVASSGVLDREARVLRIQALQNAGDVAGARKLTDQYLLDFPNDAHAARLRAQAGNGKP